LAVWDRRRSDAERARHHRHDRRPLPRGRSRRGPRPRLHAGRARVHARNAPLASAITITVTCNLINTNETASINTYRSPFPFFAPELENAIEAFPVLSLLGLDLEPVELARLLGGFIGLFANLHGMPGADAGCTTNDAQSLATLACRVNFDVVSVPGEQWTLDLDHSIRGARNRISDGYNDDIGGRSNSQDVEFSGSGATRVSGDGKSALRPTFPCAIWAFAVTMATRR
jgi:hypothetical protein